MKKIAPLYNLAPASPLDDVVYGSGRPCRDRMREIEAEEVEPWLDAMAQAGMEQVVCLMDDHQLGYYAFDLLACYRRRFRQVVHVPVEDYSMPGAGAVQQVLEALSAAEAMGQKVVVHCSAGMGRTGFMLTAWLRARHGLDLEPALELVRRHARGFDVVRHPLECGEQRVREALQAVAPGSVQAP